MTEWPDALLRDLGAPRPLPAALRTRLEDALAAGTVEVEDDGDVVVALAGLDGPRPVPGRLHQSMADALSGGVTRSRGARWRQLAVAAAVVALVGGGTGAALTLTGGRPATTAAQRPGQHGAPAGSANAASGASPSAEAPNPLAGPGKTDNAASGDVASGGGGVGSALGVAPPGPSVSSVSPNAGPAAGGTIVVVTGADFTGATTVSFGGSAAQFTVVSPTELRAVAPAHATGAVDVVVTGSGAASASGPGDRFTYR